MVRAGFENSGAPWRRAGWLWAIAALVAPLAGADLAAQATSEEAVDTTVTIRTEGSALAFFPDQIALKAGTRVRIRYVNEGTLPHNIVFVKDGADIDVLGPAAFEASETGYVPLQYEDRMYGHSDLVAPGETGELVFTVPPPGEYFFVCLYAGHYNMMYGTMRSVP